MTIMVFKELLMIQNNDDASDRKKVSRHKKSQILYKNCPKTSKINFKLVFRLIYNKTTSKILYLGLTNTL